MGAAEFKKEKNVMHCPECNKVIDISMSSGVSAMRVENQALRNALTEAVRNKEVMRRVWIGQKMAFHKTIKNLYDLMNEAQRKEAVCKSQQLRDDLRCVQRKYNPLVKKQPPQAAEREK